MHERLGEQADTPSLVLHHEQPAAQRRAGAIEAESRPQVDDRHDLAAREHHTFDEPRRIRHRRDVLEHLDVQNVLAPEGVGGSRDAEQDVGLRSR